MASEKVDVFNYRMRHVRDDGKRRRRRKRRKKRSPREKEMTNADNEGGEMHIVFTDQSGQFILTSVCLSREIE
jgi:hypothetical protein